MASPRNLAWVLFYVLYQVHGADVGVESKRSKEVYKSFVEVIPTTTKNYEPNPNLFWCKNAQCDTQLLSSCNTVTYKPFLCCPVCGCTNTVGMKVKVGERFRLWNKHEDPCFICQCETRFYRETPFADCREVHCPNVKEMASCKNTFTPAGQCCQQCLDNKLGSTEGKQPLTFPPIPPIPEEIMQI